MPTAPRAERFSSLDTLRGFAVLGILMVNVQYFSMVWVAADFPTAHMDFSTNGNRLVWWITQTFFTLKFITLFSALFGAGIVLMLGEGEASHNRHIRRMCWLLGFGLVHAYVFWFGDILVPYALAGMVVVAARRMSVTGLLVLGGGLMAFTGLLWVGGTAMGNIIGDTMTAAEAMGFGPERVTEVTALYQAGFVERLPYNLGVALQWQLVQLVLFSGRIVGVMLLGMAAYKSGFLTLKWSVRQYAICAAVASTLGFGISAWASSTALDSGFAPSAAFAWTLGQYVGSLVLAFGYAATIMLVCKLDLVAAVQDVLAAVGRMAFSNYLAQTLIMTVIFVGMPGLGLFGTVERSGQALIVLAVWAVQLACSPLWLRYFHHGPLEWAWRSLTYGQAQPFRRPPPDQTV